MTNSTGNQEFLFILVNFRDDRREPFKPSDLEDLIFNAPFSIKNYYLANSFGKTTITGRVLNKWYTIPTDQASATGDCASNISNWESEANKLVSENVYNLTSYRHIFYTFPSIPICSEFGSGSMVGNPTRGRIFTDHLNTTNDRFGYAHEIGHNLGIHHANLWNCSPQAVDIGSKCTNLEYGDKSDSMGDPFDFNHFNGPHKLAEGWITSNQIQSVSRSGNYILAASNQTSSLPQMLKIPLPGDREFYYLEYRKLKDQFDTNLPSDLTKGVSIRLWNDDPLSQTKLIDPAGRGKMNSLVNNQSFHDEINNISITQKSSDSTQAAVNVQFGTPLCIYSPPTVSISQKDIGGAVGSWNVTGFSVTNNDTPACGQTTFETHIHLPNDQWGGSVLDDVVTLLPGKTKFSALVITSPDNAEARVYPFALEVSVGGTNARSSSDTASFTVFGTGQSTPSSSPNPSSNPGLAPPSPSSSEPTSAPLPSKHVTAIKFTANVNHEDVTLAEVNLNDLNTPVDLRLPNLAEGTPGITVIKANVTYYQEGVGETSGTYYLPFNYLNFQGGTGEIIPETTPLPTIEGAIPIIPVTPTRSQGRPGPRGIEIQPGNLCGSYSGSNAGLPCSTGYTCLDGTTPTTTYGTCQSNRGTNTTCVGNNCTYISPIPTATPRPTPTPGINCAHQNESCYSRACCIGTGVILTCNSSYTCVAQ